MLLEIGIFSESRYSFSSFIHLFRIQANRSGDKNGEVHPPDHRFEDRQSPCAESPAGTTSPFTKPPIVTKLK